MALLDVEGARAPLAKGRRGQFEIFQREAVLRLSLYYKYYYNERYCFR